MNLEDIVIEILVVLLLFALVMYEKYHKKKTNGKAWSLMPIARGEALRSSVTLYRENFIPLIRAQLPLTIIYVATISSLIFHYTEIALALVLLSFIVIPLTTASVIKLASSSVLGTPLSVKDAYKFTRQNWLKYIFTHFFLAAGLAGALLLTDFFLGLVIHIGQAMEMEGASSIKIILTGSIMITLFMFFPANWWTSWMGTFPVAVNEEIFLRKGMKRSKQLMKGDDVGTFLVLLPVFLIKYIVLFSPPIAAIVLWIVATALGGNVDVPEAIGRNLVVLMMLSGIVAIGVIDPLLNTTRVVLYFKLRSLVLWR